MKDLDSLINTFYEEPNEVDISLLPTELREPLQVLHDRFTEGLRTLIPAIVEGQMSWYGIARSAGDARLLAEEMASWLGPPLGEEPSVVVEANDELDKKALSLSENGILLRTRVSPGWEGQARNNVRGLIDIWLLTPDRARDKPRTLGQILRNFYEAIAEQDRDSATDALDEIRAGGMLSTTNMSFLKVELLGELGTPEELRDDPTLAGISQLRCPPTVSDYLARAADELFIRPGAENSNRKDCRSLAKRIRTTWPNIIAHPSQVRSVHGARCLALSELLDTKPRQGVIDHLLSEWSSEDALVSRIVDSLQETLGPTSEPTTNPVGMAAITHYNLHGEFELLLNAAEKIDQPDIGVVSLVMYAAFNLADTDSAARAVAMVDRLTSADREELLGRAVEKSLHAQLLDRNKGTQIPNGWRDWLKGDWPDQPTLLKEWSKDWTIESITAGEEADLFEYDLLDALNNGTRERVRNGLPIFVLWLTHDDHTGAAAIPLATTILEIMLDFDAGSGERSTALDLLKYILQIGCSSKEYCTIADALSRQLKSIGRDDIDWLRDVLDFQICYAVPDTKRRSELFAQSSALLQRWIADLNHTDAFLLQKIFKMAGSSLKLLPVDAAPLEYKQRKKTFRTVGIHTLDPVNAHRCRDWIKDEWKNVKIYLSHDKANNKKLQGFIRKSDVILMQTSRAKHPATTAIEQGTKPSRLVRVKGRSASSIYRGLTDWLEADN